MSVIPQFAKNRILKQFCAGLVCATGLLAFSANIYLRLHYAAVMPRSQQPETGRVFEIPAQGGGVIFVSEQELKTREFVRIDLMALFGGSMVLNFGLGSWLGWWPLTPKPRAEAPKPKF